MAIGKKKKDGPRIGKQLNTLTNPFYKKKKKKKKKKKTLINTTYYTIYREKIAFSRLTISFSVITLTSPCNDHPKLHFISRTHQMGPSLYIET